LRRLEQTLGFDVGELLSQAQLQRTPKEVRAMLQRLMENKSGVGGGGSGVGEDQGNPTAEAAVDLDQAFATGVLQELVEQITPNVEAIETKAVPVINRVSAGYPSDFTDLSYPPRVADEYVGCPEVNDTEAFAARVHGDSMVPKYRPGDIVIFSPAATVREGDDCFVRFADGQTTFKRVFFETSESGESLLRLQPRNERYRPQSVEAEKVSGLYRAMFKYQRVDEE
jgi:SOS-response transcriptional repressor LexA